MTKLILIEVLWLLNRLIADRWTKCLNNHQGYLKKYIESIHKALLQDQTDLFLFKVVPFLLPKINL